MAEPVVITDSPPTQNTREDVDMQGEGVDGGGDDGPEPADDGEDEGMTFPDVVEAPKRTSFLEYLKSPVVELAVGGDSSSIILSVHQDLLKLSPILETACAEFGARQRRIDLPDDDLEAVGSFVEYLYRGDYFPRTVDNTLENHNSIPDIDSDGTYLLKHARVYTLAEKFQIPALKSLAHAKIQLTTSTARGEIAYARYVYGTTSRADTVIRRPVAAFWGTRSHVLRHEAEEEFRAMCLEFPQFGFDVLSMVLDQKEKRAGGGRESGPTGVAVGVETAGTGRGRKRARNF